MFPVDQDPIDPSITEAALHVGEALVAGGAAFMGVTTTVLLLPMIKINIKPTSAHTITTIRAHKIISIKMGMAIIQVQLPKLSTLSRARQTDTLRVTAVLKVRLKLRLNIQCDIGSCHNVVASVELQSKRGKTGSLSLHSSLGILLVAKQPSSRALSYSLAKAVKLDISAQCQEMSSPTYPFISSCAGRRNALSSPWEICLYSATRCATFHSALPATCLVFCLPKLLISPVSTPVRSLRRQL